MSKLRRTDKAEEEPWWINDVRDIHDVWHTICDVSFLVLQRTFIVSHLAAVYNLTVYQCKRMKFNTFFCPPIFMRSFQLGLSIVITENKLIKAELRECTL